MALIKEPKNIDLNIKSKEWSEKDLKDFRAIMKKIKSKKKAGKSVAASRRKKAD
ncbi:MAG: hypothetical protein JSS63_03195 [Bacteroidetes bacterium]|nr:hypothetical protein [Bacteroidota bacterium]